MTANSFTSTSQHGANGKKAPMQAPNVVIAIVDDLAYGDLTCHGNPYTRTAFLDRLHAESVRLTHYCSGPLCTPARAALFTGRHPFRTRAIDTYLGRSTLDPDEKTLAQLFHRAGYATGLYGKWHLGDTKPSDPNSMGFQEALYHTAGGLRQEGNYGRNSYFDPDLIHNGQRVLAQGYCTDIFTEAACDFIRSSERPFFCYLAFNAIHTPLEIVEHWADPFRQQGIPERWARLYGMLQNLDENIGKLTDCLNDEDLRENTILLFTADHGPCASVTDKGRSRFNGTLRGMKGEFYEGGIKVPSFWSWPNAWAPRNIDLLANPIDILPTLSELCGLQLPDDRKIDGLSLAEVLNGSPPATSLQKRTVCMQWHRGARPIRGNNAVCLGPRYKWYSVAPGTEELYDLLEEPSERQNIIDDKPMIAKKLADTYEAWFDDVCAERDLLDRNKEPGVPIVIETDGTQPTILTWQDWVPYSGEEGFSLDNPGYWPVSVPEAGTYRIVIDRFKNDLPADLHFQLGPVSMRIPPVYKVQTLCFEIELPVIQADLHLYFMQGEQRLGCQFVSIRRQIPTRPTHFHSDNADGQRLLPAGSSPLG